MSLSEVSTRRRLTPHARRAELLRAAEAVFAANPYDEVSVEDIADAAGVSKNLLYHYFSGKRDLYLSIIRSAAREVFRRTEPDLELPPIDRLRASIDQHLRYVEEHSEGYIKLLQGAGGDPEVLALVDDVREAGVRRATGAIPLDGARPPPGVTLTLHGQIVRIHQPGRT